LVISAVAQKGLAPLLQKVWQAMEELPALNQPLFLS